MIKKEWRSSQLATWPGLDPGNVSYLLNRKRNPGPEVSRAIALDLPEDEVFRQAGLLSPKQEEPPTLSEWIHIFMSADEKERDRMIEVAKTLLRESRK